MSTARPGLIVCVLVAAGATARTQVTHEARGPYADLGRAVRMIERAQLDEAEALLVSVVKDVPAHGPAWHQLALCRKLLGKDEAAIAAIRTSVELDPKNPEALLLAAELLVKADADQAVAHAKQACAEAKGNPRIQARAIRVLWILQRHQDALALVDKALAACPKDHDLLTMKADVALTIGQYAEAADAYRVLEELRPFDAVPPQNLAGALVLLGRKEEAAKALQRSLTVRPSNTVARRKLIALLEALKQDPEEIAAEKAYLKYYSGTKIPDPPKAIPGAEPPALPTAESLGTASKPTKGKDATGPKPARPGGN